MPPAASTLGFHLISAEPDHGLITVGFVATRSFTNPFGEVLGGFLAAMLVTPQLTSGTPRACLALPYGVVASETDESADLGEVR
jgi:hypothetical protein